MRQKDVSGPPVATPSLTLGRDRVAIGSPLKMTYKFQVAPDAKIDGDYIVFVHVLDPEGERLWDDDHMPPVRTSQWKPGQTSSTLGRSSFRTTLTSARRPSARALPEGNQTDTLRNGSVAA